MVVPRRIELLSADYQSIALPLSYRTIFLYQIWDIKKPPRNFRFRRLLHLKTVLFSLWHNTSVEGLDILIGDWGDHKGSIHRHANRHGNKGCKNGDGQDRHWNSDSLKAAKCRFDNLFISRRKNRVKLAHNYQPRKPAYIVRNQFLACLYKYWLRRIQLIFYNYHFYLIKSKI